MKSFHGLLTVARVVRPVAFDYDAKTSLRTIATSIHALHPAKNRIETSVAPTATVAVFFCIGLFYSNAKKAAFDGLFCWFYLS